jgi:hypothetical protein
MIGDLARTSNRERLNVRNGPILWKNNVLLVQKVWF